MVLKNIVIVQIVNFIGMEYDIFRNSWVFIKFFNAFSIEQAENKNIIVRLFRNDIVEIKNRKSEKFLIRLIR